MLISVTVYIQRPTPSSLVRSRVDRENCFVNADFGAEVAQGFILCHILLCAPGLVIMFAVVACGAGVPQWDVISTREAVVPVVEELVGVRCRAWTSGGWWRRRNAVRGGWRDGRSGLLVRRVDVAVVVVAASPAGGVVSIVALAWIWV